MTVLLSAVQSLIASSPPSSKVKRRELTRRVPPASILRPRTRPHGLTIPKMRCACHRQSRLYCSSRSGPVRELPRFLDELTGARVKPRNPIVARRVKAHYQAIARVRVDEPAVWQPGKIAYFFSFRRCQQRGDRPTPKISGDESVSGFVG